MRKAATFCAIAFVLLGFCVAPAAADWFNSVNAYNDGETTWAGTSTFSSAPLAGYIEWAVIESGEFASNFPNPSISLPAGQFAYVYQIHNTGTVPISYCGVGLENEAHNIDWFTSLPLPPLPPNPSVDGISPYSSKITPYAAAEWFFSAFSAGTTSTGLVFTSPNKPIPYYGLVINGGENAEVTGIMSPGPERIPEPATIGLVASGLCAAIGTYWLRRR